MVNLIALSLLGATPAVVGRVVALRGSARADGQDIQRGTELHDGQVLLTGGDARMRLLMHDHSMLDLGANARMELRYVTADKRRTVSLRLMTGKLWARVSKFVDGESDYEVRTSNAVAGVRGTQLVVDAESQRVACVDGSVEVGDKTLGPMEAATVGADGNVDLGVLGEEELQGFVRDLTPDPGLDRENAVARVDSVTSQSQAVAAPPPDEDGGADPPLDLEPASGIALIRGRIRIHER
jgi:hypothetical protein